MKRLRSALTTAAATALLSVCGVVLASPAHAEADVNLLGGVATVTLDGTIDVTLLGIPLPSLPNLLEGTI
ncbi:hypothetical protein GO001_04565 [Streptomyces sp. NRRL B-1677]|uniref:DUF320 domain-containing protein n=1 Tax=Streptomyces klenkii TaxID=1420899 RepID=A0A3B0B7D6_9ACTN|nr:MULTISPECIES: hypothetical protein [Streptomyces]MBF6044497.1 hypothetical protein [Streptomyces sp. NRRL B-1677]RKN69943.1 hypothetical protein D7231_23150 [Streptomyces klenkii]